MNCCALPSAIVGFVGVTATDRSAAWPGFDLWRAGQATSAMTIATAVAERIDVIRSVLEIVMGRGPDWESVGMTGTEGLVGSFPYRRDGQAS